MSEKRPRRAGAFDIRNFIGTLLGVYGLVLLVTGLVATDDAAVEKAGGVNLNLWTGVALVVASAVFVTWARLRPVVVPPDVDHDDTD
jgi:hypothetical protein